jgi:hypothetical protein
MTKVRNAVSFQQKNANNRKANIGIIRQDECSGKRMDFY